MIRQPGLAAQMAEQAGAPKRGDRAIVTSRAKSLARLEEKVPEIVGESSESVGLRNNLVHGRDTEGDGIEGPPIHSNGV